MGGICSCCDDPNNETSLKTPLLSGSRSKPVVSTTTTQPVPSYMREAQEQQWLAAANTPSSVRQNRPPESADAAAKEKEFLTSLDHVSEVSLHQLPAELATINKTFQDHGKLYNDLNGQFQELRQALHDFKAKFVAETSGIPVTADCLHLLAKRCGGASLKARRDKHCIQLEYDRREVSEKCSGLPEDTLEALDLYNRINRLIKTVLERAPQVGRSLKLVLDDEHELKKEVTKCDLPGERGPDALKHCSDNLNRLHKIPAYIDTIQKYTNRIFKEILEGSKVLLQAEDGVGDGL